jgi:hypothetical protein
MFQVLKACRSICEPTYTASYLCWLEWLEFLMPNKMRYACLKKKTPSQTENDYNCKVQTFIWSFNLLLQVAWKKWALGPLNVQVVVAVAWWVCSLYLYCWNWRSERPADFATKPTALIFSFAFTSTCGSLPSSFTYTLSRQNLIMLL